MSYPMTDLITGRPASATIKTLTIKNKKTGTAESIQMQDLTYVSWGFYFFVENELDAYKAAYAYRESKHGAKIDYAGGVQRWRVTVFTDVINGIDIHG